MAVALEAALPARITEADLWGAVLFQVVVDLAASDRWDREGAEHWVGRAPSLDFVMVCDLAGLEPRRTHAFLREVIATPWETRRVHAHGKAGRESRGAPRGPTVAPPGLATTRELAEVAGLSSARINQLAAGGALDGCFERIGDRRYYRPAQALAALNAARRASAGGVQ